MRLETKRKLTKKEIKNFQWHCGSCGRPIPLKREFILGLYLKEKSQLLVCEYWCKYDGIITRFEYYVKNAKDARGFIKKMNIYTDTQSGNER